MGKSPEMQSKDKLAEARYFLDRLHGSATKVEEFNYNLSAFLGAAHSVMDVMVYDFVELFDLGFSRDDKFTPRDFLVASKAKGKKDALVFLEWWNDKYRLLNSNPIWARRHFVVHRGYPKMEVFYKLNVSGAQLDVSLVDSWNTGRLKAERFIVVDTPVGRHFDETIKDGIFLFEGPKQDIRILCDGLFDKLSDTVKEAEMMYWKPQND